MPRQRSPDRGKAMELYIKSGGEIKLVDIATELELKPSQIRKWKCQDKWDDVLGEYPPNLKQTPEQLLSNVTNKPKPKKKSNATKRKDPTQPVDPVQSASLMGNHHGLKHGLLAKYLPDETLEIVNDLEDGYGPINILYDQIVLTHANIIRSLKIMHVTDKEDKTKEIVSESFSDKASSVTYQVQQAWDKQANFLGAVAAAQRTLTGMIKQYTAMVNDLTPEKRNMYLVKIEQIKQVDKDVEITYVSGIDRGDDS